MNSGSFKAGTIAACALVAAQLAAAPFKDGDVVVFLGDSITHGGRYHEYLADYYSTRFPEATIRFVNSGIGGDTAPGAMPRIDEDVAEYGPSHVTFHFGMNDIDRGAYGLESTDESLRARERAQAAYRANLPKLVKRVRQAAPKAKFVYLTPTPYEDTAVVTNAPKSGWASFNNVGCNAGLSLMAGYVLEKAAADKVEAVDWYSPLNAFRVRHQRENPYFSITGPDRVHSAELGHSIMAWVFLQRQGVPAVVSEVTVDAAKGQVVACENAALSGLECKDGRIAFTLLAKALPFPVAPAALAYAREFKVEQTLNRETVTVKGLEPVTYVLTIDGEEVAKATAAELEAGLYLGFNAKTPQYRQAQAVARRHAELWERERVLRNHHSARWFYRGRAPVDDIPAFRAWYERDLKAGGAEAGSYFGQFIPGYLEYWPRYREVREELWQDQLKVRELAKPVPHRYELLRMPLTSPFNPPPGLRDGRGEVER